MSEVKPIGDRRLREIDGFLAASRARVVEAYADDLRAFIARLRAAEAERDKLREALAWYAEMAAGCRKLGSLGNPARHALDADGGKCARDALGQVPTP